MYFSFARPEYLWYLFAVPLVILTHFILLKYSKRRAIKFANFRALKRVSEQKLLTKNYLLLFIRVAIVLFLVLAISGTTVWFAGRSTQSDYVLALDISASMSAEDMPPTRLEVAKQYGQEFISKTSFDSSVGVVSFSGATFIEQLPTTDKSKSKKAIADLDIAKSGGTDITDALVTSSNLLLSSTVHGKSIILITDGSNTAGYFARDPIGQGIRYAQENNIMVYTIGIGSNSGPIGYLPEYYNVSSVYNSAILQRIANETGGHYFHAQTNQQLQAAYNQILEDSKSSYVSLDLGLGLLIVSLLLLFLEWGLMNTHFKTFPE